MTLLRILALLILAACGSSNDPPAALAFDPTDYRQATYGAPDHYCDLSLSIAAPSGAGTIGDPWNATRCMSEPVAGEVIGLLPGVSESLTTRGGTGQHDVPAFQPANSGTAGNPIVYVTKYAAVALSTPGANPNRTQFRHDGTAATEAAGGQDGTGGAMLGAYRKSHIVYDGFYIDMASAQIVEDTGMLTCRGTAGGDPSTGIEFRNYYIQGTSTQVNSNAVIWRPDYCLDSVHSNFIVEGHTNICTRPTCAQGQGGFWSDGYGDENFLVEHFRINDVDNGIFPKGSANGNTSYNYGTIRYGIVSNLHYRGSATTPNSGVCVQVHALHASELTTVHHVLCHDYGVTGFNLDDITINVRNVLFHHLTAADGCVSLECSALDIGQFDTTAFSNVTVRDSIFDITAGSQRWYVNANDVTITLPTMNYNGYYASGGQDRWAHSSGEQTTLSGWQGRTGSPDLNSTVLGSDPFTNRAAGVYTIAAAHSALSASSTGGELGAYEGSHVIGPDTTSATTTSITGNVTFSGSVSIQ